MAPLQTVNGRLLLSWALLLSALKLYLGWQLELYHDEAFYWQCAQQLALAYADHPFMTALLVRIGTEFFGDTTLGVRFLFLIMGCTFPIGIYLLARCRCQPQEALLAASFSLLMPFTATLGLIAMPDVPLLFFALFGLIAFEKAVRRNNLSSWVIAGAIAALGLSTHYRFILFPAAAFIYFVATPNGRKQWRNSRFWLTIIIMLCGLLPVLLFNLGNQFEALNYQFSERQAWQFQSKGLRHPLEQMLVVTPLLYIALICAAVMGAKKAIRGDDQAALLIIFAGFPLATYLFLAPFSDREHIFFHWPTLGYIPLFALLPEFIRAIQQRLSRLTFRLLLSTTVLVGAGFSLILLGGVGASISPALLKQSPPGSLAYELTGWNSLQQKTNQLLKQQPANSLLVFDRYFVNAEISFLNPEREAPYLLDHPKNREHGRAFQYRLWEQDEPALKLKTGQPVLIVIQESDSEKEHQFMQSQQLCTLFDNLVWLDRLDLFNGEKRYQFFSATISEGGKLENCQATPSIGRLDKPRLKKGTNSIYNISGWTFNEANRIQRVELLLEGKGASGALNYGLKRDHIQKLFPDSVALTQPNIGFNGELDMSGKTPGTYRINARVTSKDGGVTILKSRHIKIGTANE